jgi:hypothetical protein
MNIPHQIKIKGKMIHVFFSDELIKGKYLGEFDPNTLTIYISRAQSERNQESTFLHELLHCISELYELGLTESQVTGLERPLIRAITKLWQKKLK